jgi:hypothetical protein
VSLKALYSPRKDYNLNSPQILIIKKFDFFTLLLKDKLKSTLGKRREKINKDYSEDGYLF